ncbi:MAG: DUF2149 domain-containing protein [Opitutaceae bacterium]|jgi:hypothetical protein|nr:DUF2149 domain-containing protein [Opitutaceae bacterium]
MRFVQHTRHATPRHAAPRHAAHSPAPGEDEDPLAGIANLFDVSVAFIVALLIALFALFSAGTFLDKNSEVTLVKTTAGGETEIITKKGAEIKVQKVTGKNLSGQGTRLGTAYRLANGQVVYVPENDTP